ncbi:MAG: hypothetical protein FWD22_03155 [Treponema sp.]|nr:hypothetical protein [Treponema sp.]
MSALIKKIIEQKNVSANEAFSSLYNSKLYILLDDEQTKVWHYSTEKLYHLFEEEMNTGNFDFPEC